MTPRRFYVGLMSGTSADAIDAVLVESGSSIDLIATHSSPLPNDIRERIHALCSSGHDEIDRMGCLDVELGREFAKTVLALIKKAGCDAEEIIAIGSHGQTIRHRPPGSQPSAPFTLQIGDPNTIAELTGITTVADFRRRDMAAGGQGAPLVPAFHRAIFHSADKYRAIVNIGGMANITWLPPSGGVIGFDTGPGNVLMDGWIKQYSGKTFDSNGDWAASGKPHVPLLNKLLSHGFFSLTPPKSTGREEFHLGWLQDCLNQCSEAIAPADIQATLLQLSSQSITKEINHLGPEPKEIIVCGGGAYNGALMTALKTALPKDEIYTSADFGIAPEWIEAMAFAWLAEQTLAHKPGNLSAVTGARREVILGGIYFA